MKGGKSKEKYVARRTGILVAAVPSPHPKSRDKNFFDKNYD